MIVPGGGHYSPSSTIIPTTGEILQDKNVIVIIVVIFLLILSVAIGLGLYMAERSKQSESQKKLYSRTAEIAILVSGSVAMFLLLILGVVLVFVFPGRKITADDLAASLDKANIQQLKENARFAEALSAPISAP